MLVLAGAGLSPHGITSEVIQLLKQADKVYVDTYTSPKSHWVYELALRHNERSEIASRKTLEDESSKIIEEAREKTIVILSPGDPLVATAHQALLAEAQSRGIEVRYVPGVSGVTTAKTFSGLSYYRFGRTVTAPGPWRGAGFSSVLLTVYGNLCIDAHTLVLLDISDEGEMIRPSSAMENLLKYERELSETLGIRLIAYETPVILVVAAGRDTGKVLLFDSPIKLIASKGLSDEPSSIIIPAPLSGTESWILEMRIKKKLSSIWTKRSYSRREVCSNYERLFCWISEG
ncbi:MAG: diphthine synthase [Acidilobaceae archaeon]